MFAHIKVAFLCLDGVAYQWTFRRIWSRAPAYFLFSAGRMMSVAESHERMRAVRRPITCSMRIADIKKPSAHRV